MKQRRNSGEKTSVMSNPVIKDEGKLDFQLRIKEFPWSENQRAFLDMVEDKSTKMVFLKGPAGTAKTLLAVYSALVALDEHKTSEIIYLRQPVESSTFNLGFLKGSAQEKMNPYTQPLADKLEELLSTAQSKRLFEEERITSVPIGFLRGLSFNNASVILDEAQNLPMSDFLTVLTRIGAFSKALICGDTMQSDIRNSAFERIYSGFNTEQARAQGIRCYEFTSADIFRSPILGFIIETMEKIKAGVQTSPS